VDLRGTNDWHSAVRRLHPRNHTWRFDHYGYAIAFNQRGLAALADQEAVTLDEKFLDTASALKRKSVEIYEIHHDARLLTETGSVTVLSSALNRRNIWPARLG
jgi:hypothetical protein